MSTEFLTIYWRDMLRFVRFRIVLVVSLIQPALWMALYGAAMSNNFSRLGSGMVVPEGAVSVSYLTFMGAGVIALTTLFTSLFGGMGSNPFAVIISTFNKGLMIFNCFWSSIGVRPVSSVG